MLDFSLERLLISLPAILLALSFHEFSHGFVAYKMGDPTPKYQGRLTLNPMAHLDPIGTLLLIFARFGWAKPVMVNPLNFRGNKQRAMLLVALAGPLSNLVLAFLGGLLFYTVNKYNVHNYWTGLTSALLIINVSLALFNLIPVPPLDGSKILAGLLPSSMQHLVYQLEAYGPIILILLIFTNVLDKTLWPLVGKVVNFISEICYLIIFG